MQDLNKTSEQILLLPRGQFTPLNEVTIPGMINTFIYLVLVTASILFVFSLLFGGIKLIISGGNREKVDIARRQVINAILGIVVVFTSWAIIGIVSEFFGVELQSFEIPAF